MLVGFAFTERIRCGLMGSMAQSDLTDPSSEQSGCRWLLSGGNTKGFVVFGGQFSFLFFF